MPQSAPRTGARPKTEFYFYVMPCYSNVRNQLQSKLSIVFFLHYLLSI